MVIWVPVDDSSTATYTSINDAQTPQWASVVTTS